MSQSELAEKLDIAQQTVSRYEQGLREPDIITLIKLSEIFDCSIDYLLGRTTVKEKNTKINKPLEEYIKEAESLLLYGDIVDEKDKEAILTAIKVAYETAIKKNKEQKNRDNK